MNMKRIIIVLLIGSSTIAFAQQQRIKEEGKKVEPMEQNIFFAINSARISEDQQLKVNDLVTYLNKYPECKVCITGYADKDTGTPNYNKMLSEKRAVSVAEALKTKGLSAERIRIEFKGDTVQPFGTAAENRVSICLVL